MPNPTIGRTVLYRLSEQDAQTIQHNRSRTGRQGNGVRPGDICPAVIVRVWDSGQGGLVNLQVVLDGEDRHWATSRSEGTEPGTWAWPERV